MKPSSEIEQGNPRDWPRGKKLMGEEKMRARENKVNKVTKQRQ